jgi:hypothetical protein
VISWDQLITAMRESVVEDAGLLATYVSSRGYARPMEARTSNRSPRQKPSLGRLERTI